MSNFTCQCAHCDKPAVLVAASDIYPHRHDLAHKSFWRCLPCGAHVGCHDRGAWWRDEAGHRITSDGTAPLGRAANAELRVAKQRAHSALDPIWKTRQLGRNEAYRWLAKKLGIGVHECHIGMFTLAQCRATVEVCEQRAMELVE